VGVVPIEGLDLSLFESVGCRICVEWAIPSNGSCECTQIILCVQSRTSLFGSGEMRKLRHVIG
jgi:hypothetical protein